MSDPTVSLSNDSRLVDDIESVFKNTSILAAEIRNILTTGIGGNPFPMYVEFKKQFDFLLSMSSDHKSIRELEIIDDIKSWRDKRGLSVADILNGLNLFDKYKTQLFKSNILRYS